MNLLTQFHVMTDAMERGDMSDMVAHLTNLRIAIRESEMLVSTVLGEHREHHEFSPATCWSLACRLASKA